MADPKIVKKKAQAILDKNRVPKITIDDVNKNAQDDIAAFALAAAKLRLSVASMTGFWNDLPDRLKALKEGQASLEKIGNDLQVKEYDALMKQFKEAIAEGTQFQKDLKDKLATAAAEKKKVK